ncbi:alpha-N-arabinofuranosidase [Catenovulum sp. 2E275]|uniref:alpha-N-arabinofuranosidase n=1 Tax=Catenovulum sp. 2E275 TaxID=2980497 RepID=UPI0021D25977|nr:alpha-L-arabinofuranosidase C-terminal domain-containing protein [Catenovulum sp. 2E275]MCU4674063.1 alpha-N-arabinofuranosidase [Catenovulum sp. 2E275]
MKHLITKSIKTVGVCSLGVLSLTLSLPAFSVEHISINIDTNQTGSKINKNIYGQFTEHLGRGIYEGIWVGTDSDIPNTKGYRNDVLNALKSLKVPVMRWPGGCFADEYHWRDGIGERNKRPVRVNSNWGGVEESNQFGTHEFFELAEMIGSETYLNVNLGTGTAQEMAQWLEYMTSTNNSSLAQERRANGRDEPFKIDYLTIGNEAWGCGGNMTPEFYSHLYNQYATFAKTYNGTQPVFVASGGTGDDTSWTDVLSKNKKAKMDAISFHYYTLPTNDWSVKGKAINFPESEWHSTMINTLKMEKFIQDNIAVLDKNDPEGEIGFYVDEWGAWYDVEADHNPGFLYQQNTIRDAVIAATNLNIFHRYAERVQMTNIAQMINVLQAMILTDKEKMLLTPTYHTFKMYVPFQDATHIPVQTEQMAYESFEGESYPVVSASAAKALDGKTYIALVNLSASDEAEVKINLQGEKAKLAKGQLLTSPKMNTFNSFDNPERVKPVKVEHKVKSGQLNVKLPAHSVMVIQLN